MHVQKQFVLLVVSAFLGALMGSGMLVLAAWTGPLSDPPAGNVDAPVNTGGISQIKDGSLGVNALAVFGNAILSGSDLYLNFGEEAGEDGYGIRDNDGAIEYKDNEGEWVALSSIEGGGGGVTPGTQNYTEPGAYTFTVPEYNNLTVEVWGAGGGGGSGGCYYGSHGNHGVSGENSSFGNFVVAEGGERGTRGLAYQGGDAGQNGSGGDGGVASGGDTNVNGEDGTNGNHGSSGGNGGDGGGSITPLGESRTIGEGGNGSGGESAGSGSGGGGGGGALVIKTFSSDEVSTGDITVVVGSGGSGGNGSCVADGQDGNDGRVEIEWN